MSYSRSQSQPVKYRYRPNVGMKHPTTTTTSSTPVAPLSTFQSPIASSEYAATQAMLRPSRLDMDAPFYQGHVVGDEEGDKLWASYRTLLPTNHLHTDIPQHIAGMEQSYTPDVSSWTSTTSSVASDPYSGGAWSSPVSSLSFSPEPAYQIPYVDSTQWFRDNPESYFGEDCIWGQEFLHSQALESIFGNGSVHMSEVSQTSQCQFTPEPLLPAFESPDLDSRRESPNSISEHADDLVLKRTDSFMTDCNASPVSIVPVTASSGSSSPTRPKSSPYQGQLLDFSPCVAQAKPKGPKSAALPCPLAAYGCTSSFISKNEWKRHINTQHLRLEAWLCDECPKRDNKREFNRKDLFIQHLKRMHPSPCRANPPKVQAAKAKTATSPAAKNEKSGGKASKGDDTDPALLEAEQRCHIVLRQPPSESACLFCSADFSGRGSWEARIEHVAKHMEQYKKEGKDVPSPKTWRADRALEQWLVRENVITKVRQRWSVA